MATITEEEIRLKEVRGLSIKQPFAELVKRGLKHETRIFNFPWQGLVLICSSKEPFNQEQVLELAGQDNYYRIEQTLTTNWRNEVKRAKAIAIGRITGSFSAKLWETEQTRFEAKTWVKWRPELFVHTFSDVREIKPFQVRGRLGYFTLTPEEKKLIHLV